MVSIHGDRRHCLHIPEDCSITGQKQINHRLLRVTCDSSLHRYHVLMWLSLCWKKVFVIESVGSCKVNITFTLCVWCSYAEGAHNVFFSSSILSNISTPVSTYNQPFSVNSSVNSLLEYLLKCIFFCRCLSLLGRIYLDYSYSGLFHLQWDTNNSVSVLFQSFHTCFQFMC